MAAAVFLSDEGKWISLTFGQGEGARSDVTPWGELLVCIEDAAVVEVEVEDSAVVILPAEAVVARFRGEESAGKDGGEVVGVAVESFST